MTYIHKGVVFNLEKEGNPVISTMWLNLRGTMLTEISQAPQDK
jgi:hypothetical protein